jgi:hypothetical protein
MVNRCGSPNLHVCENLTVWFPAGIAPENVSTSSTAIVTIGGLSQQTDDKKNSNVIVS